MSRVNLAVCVCGTRAPTRHPTNQNDSSFDWPEGWTRPGYAMPGVPEGCQGINFALCPDCTTSNPDGWRSLASVSEVARVRAIIDRQPEGV